MDQCFRHALHFSAHEQHLLKVCSHFDTAAPIGPSWHYSSHCLFSLNLSKDSGRILNADLSSEGGFCSASLVPQQKKQSTILRTNSTVVLLENVHRQTESRLTQIKFNFLSTEEEYISRRTFCIPSVPCNLIQSRRRYFPQEVQREVFSVWENQMGLAGLSIYNLDLEKQYGPKTKRPGYYGWAPDHVTLGTLLRCYPKTMGLLDRPCLIWISKCKRVRKYGSSRLQVSSSPLIPQQLTHVKTNTALSVGELLILSTVPLPWPVMSTCTHIYTYLAWEETLKGCGLQK